MRKGILLSVVCCSLFLAGCGNKNSQARKFKQIAEKTNQSCPTRISETVTLDSTSYNEKSNTVSYYYDVTGELDNPTYMNAHYATFKKALQDAVDNSVDMEEYRKAGTTIRYVYFSGSNNKPLAEFAFNSPK